MLPCLLFVAEGAAKDCQIIKGDIFKACRLRVDHEPFYENCRKDSCACETGSKCYCSAIALYAQACLEEGVEVDWRINASCGNLLIFYLLLVVRLLLLTYYPGRKSFKIREIKATLTILF